MGLFNVVVVVLAGIGSVLSIWDWFAKRLETWKVQKAKAKRPAQPTRNKHRHLAH